jgi:hypothetical protein
VSEPPLSKASTAGMHLIDEVDDIGARSEILQLHVLALHFWALNSHIIQLRYQSMSVVTLIASSVLRKKIQKDSQLCRTWHS